MKPAAKIGIVLAGYVIAGLLAWGVLSIRMATTSAADNQASGGMLAFGDSVLFAGVFGLAALLPTGAALFWLRPHRTFWQVLSLVSFVVVDTCLVALVVYLAGRKATVGSPIHAWSTFAVLRILAAPLFALAFLLAGFVAPFRAAKVALFGCTVAEAVAFGLVVFTWIASAA